MTKSRPLYYASDKAMFDALCQHKMTKSVFAELLLSRGMISSKLTSKQVLADHFCRLTHDYFDHQSIAKVLSSGHRREKSTVTRIGAPVTIEKLEIAAQSIQAQLAKVDAVVDIKVRDKGLDINIRYRELDYNKTEFRQLVTRDATISLDLDQTGVNIRHPANDYVTAVTDDCVDAVFLQFKDEEKPEIERITLVNHDDPTVRTAFFNELIKKVGPYVFHDMTDVWVTLPKNVEDDESGVQIKRVSLKGKGVNKTEELLTLIKKGFYISRIIWTAKKKAEQSDLYTLEAQFLDPESCDSFAYLVSGVQLFNKSEGMHNKGRVRAPQNDELSIYKLLDVAARRALKIVTKSES